MTFEKFEMIVKDKYPNVRMYSHGKFDGNKINVAVIFNGTHNERVYQYNGTYCEVLNKLGIKAMYKHDYESLIATLKSLKANNGKKSVFGIISDNSKEIEKYIDRLNDINSNYILV